MKRILLNLSAIGLLASCNTMIGVGRDTKIAGETLEKVAEKASPGPGDSATDSPEPVYSADDPVDLDSYGTDPAGVLPVY